jgi:hypothetical protein
MPDSTREFVVIFETKMSILSECIVSDDDEAQGVGEVTQLTRAFG